MLSNSCLPCEVELMWVGLGRRWRVWLFWVTVKSSLARARQERSKEEANRGAALLTAATRLLSVDGFSFSSLLYHLPYFLLEVLCVWRPEQSQMGPNVELNALEALSFYCEIQGKQPKHPLILVVPFSHMLKKHVKLKIQRQWQQALLFFPKAMAEMMYAIIKI